MLQDEVVRTWSGDFKKSSQHPKIKQLNSREKCVSGSAFGSWLLGFGLGRSRCCSGADPSGTACKLKRTLGRGRTCRDGMSCGVVRFRWKQGSDLGNEQIFWAT